VVALIRDQRLMANPKSVTVFEPGDRIGIIGEDEQIRLARKQVDGELDMTAF
jgi:CPA2 family monovalent cation:H+ antiporter-2